MVSDKSRSFRIRRPGLHIRELGTIYESQRHHDVRQLYHNLEKAVQRYLEVCAGCGVKYTETEIGGIEFRRYFPLSKASCWILRIVPHEALNY